MAKKNSFKKSDFFKVGAAVEWQWLGRAIEGQVKEIYFEPVVKMIKGKNIKRLGSPERPAYLVESKAGNLALKLHTELLPAGKHKKTGKNTPRMFS